MPKPSKVVNWDADATQTVRRQRGIGGSGALPANRRGAAAWPFGDRDP